MSVNIVDTVKSMFTHNFDAGAANRFGESEDGISKVISAGIPTILAALMNKSESSEEAKSIHKLALEAAANDKFAKPIDETDNSSSTSNNMINGITKVLGDKWTPMSGLIANYADVKQTTANSLLKAISAAVLNGLGTQIKQSNLSPSEMTGWLHDQKESVVSASPSGFNLAGSIGLSSLGSLGLGATNMASGVKKATDTTINDRETLKTGGNKWLLPLLVLVALAILLWYFVQRN